MRKDGGIVQWIGIVLTIIGLAYAGFKDIHTGTVKIWPEPLTEEVWPVQYCLMAYDPNTNVVWYQHENGQWYDYAPQQRRKPTTPQVRPQNQGQGQTHLGTAAWTLGVPTYGNGLPTKTPPYSQGYGAAMAGR
jgi:hypothetical protein